MKPTDFIKEDFVTDAHEAHQDHEVQMARSDCYNAAKYAIELHKMLKNISEQQGLDGWVSEKITIANDYLRTVHEYLTYEQMSHASIMPAFEPEVAEMHIESLVNEGDIGPAATAALQQGKSPTAVHYADISDKNAVSGAQTSADVGKIMTSRMGEGGQDWMQDMKKTAAKMQAKHPLPPRTQQTTTPNAAPQHSLPHKSKEELDAGIKNQMAKYYSDNHDTHRHIGDSVDPKRKMADGELDTSWMNKQHQDFYSRNPNHKRDDREIKSVGGRLASKVTPMNKPALVTKKPITKFEEMAGGMGASSVGTSMGGGNGFVNGGPGTISRPKTKKAKK